MLKEHSKLPWKYQFNYFPSCEQWFFSVIRAIAALTTLVACSDVDGKFNQIVVPEWMSVAWPPTADKVPTCSHQPPRSTSRCKTSTSASSRLHEPRRRRR